MDYFGSNFPFYSERKISGEQKVLSMKKPTVFSLTILFVHLIFVVHPFQGRSQINLPFVYDKLCGKRLKTIQFVHVIRSLYITMNC